MNHNFKNLIMLLALFLLLLTGCQDMFTTSFLGMVIKPDPSDMSGDALVAFGASALSSGDKTIMKETLTAIKDDLKDDPTNADLNYMAGQLALEVSGLTEYMVGTATGVDPATLEQNFNNNVNYLIEAGSFLETADSNNAELNSTDYILGGLGLMMTASGENTIADIADNLTSPSAGAEQEAVDFITEGVALLDADAQAMISGLLGVTF